ncbi:MAG: hypothetical protein WBO36_12875 [Saprospiraceae bacterium]
MKNFILVVSLCLFAMACKENTNTSSDSSTAIFDQDIIIVPFKQMEGEANKLPKEINLFEKYQLYPRIEKLLGQDFKEFKENWNDETPMVKYIDVMTAIGCKKDDCKSSQYLLLFDLMTNELNIYSFQNAKVRTFEEKTIIGLNDQLSDLYMKIAKDHGVY